jgi:hypothetical protein
MLFRLLISVGLVGFGYLLGREAGRAEAIREHLGSSDRQRRVGGKTFESKDYTVLDEDTGPGARYSRQDRAGSRENRDG